MHRFNITKQDNLLFEFGINNLLLIKHAMPVIQPHLPASIWTLSDNGRQRARLLGVDLKEYHLEKIYSSDELKAQATAEEIASVLKIPSKIVAGLHEHERGADDWMNSKHIFIASIKYMLEHPDVLSFGRETADETLQRFESAVAKLCANNQGSDVAVVAHGTVISLLVSKWTGLPPFPIWRCLELPDTVLLTPK